MSQGHSYGSHFAAIQKTEKDEESLKAQTVKRGFKLVINKLLQLVLESIWFTREGLHSSLHIASGKLKVSSLPLSNAGPSKVTHSIHFFRFSPAYIFSLPLGGRAH